MYERFWGPGGCGVGLNVGREHQGGSKGCLVFLEIKSQKKWMTWSGGEEGALVLVVGTAGGPREGQEGVEEGVREWQRQGEPVVLFLGDWW